MRRDRMKNCSTSILSLSYDYNWFQYISQNEKENRSEDQCALAGAGLIY